MQESRIAAGVLALGALVALTLTAQMPDQGGQAAQSRTPAEEVQENSYLRQKIQPLLPQGTDPVAAATGYQKLQQFVASAQITKNLTIPFDQFKTQFLGSAGQSLEKAVHTLKPELAHDKVSQEVAKAETQAREHIGAAEREYRAARGEPDMGHRPMPGQP